MCLVKLWNFGYIKEEENNKKAFITSINLFDYVSNNFPASKQIACLFILLLQKPSSTECIIQ